MIELTEQQSLALANPGDNPPRILDPRTNETFVLVRAEDYAKITGHEREKIDEDVAQMLAAVADFQQDDYTMTTAEAAALGASANKNSPKLKAKSLPARP